MRNVSPFDIFDKKEGQKKGQGTPIEFHPEKSLIWVALVILLIYIGSGVYFVKPGEIGVIRRFGKMVRRVDPGPHYHLPYPFEKVDIPKVEEIKKIEVGFRTIRSGPPAQYRNYPHESLMLTGDENIIDADFIVQYKIKSAPDFLFNVKDVRGTMRDIAESCFRQVVGDNTSDEILTKGKLEIQNKTAELMQHVIDKYEMGIQILQVQLQDVHPPREVLNAFKDVASAKEDKNRYINEAKGYYQDIIPKAKGKAARLINEAEAFKMSRIKRSEGDAGKYLKLLKEYKKAPDITRTRLYLETMDRIYGKTNNVIIDKNISEGIFKFIDIGEKKEE